MAEIEQMLFERQLTPLVPQFDFTVRCECGRVIKTINEGKDTDYFCYVCSGRELISVLDSKEIMESL